MKFNRSLIPSPCPLCTGPAHAGHVCEACRHDLYLSMRQVTQRCRECQAALFHNQQIGEVCADCYEHRLKLDKLYIGFDYALPIDSLILRFKNAHQQHLSHTLADLVYQRFEEDKVLDFGVQSNRAQAVPIFIPIPSSRVALKRRGYNPAAEFAKSLAKKYHAPLELNILRRHENSGQQKSLSRHARLMSSAQQYYCAYRLDVPRVILVDDIMTSGSTLDSAARALFAAGVSRVEALVIARARHRY